MKEVTFPLKTAEIWTFSHIWVVKEVTSPSKGPVKFLKVLFNLQAQCAELNSNDGFIFTNRDIKLRAERCMTKKTAVAGPVGSYMHETQRAWRSQEKEKKEI